MSWIKLDDERAYFPAFQCSECGEIIVVYDECLELPECPKCKEGDLKKWTIPPCKVGDKVYQTDGVRIYESTITNVVYDTSGIAFDERAIGESIFLTREEAEKALKERAGK